MTYPTMTQVEEADYIQLAKWYRFLPSPGHASCSRETFVVDLEEEKKILDRIIDRFNEMGGMTPELSKLIGW